MASLATDANLGLVPWTPSCSQNLFVPPCCAKWATFRHTSKQLNGIVNASFPCIARGTLGSLSETPEGSLLPDLQDRCDVRDDGKGKAR